MRGVLKRLKCGSGSLIPIFDFISVSKGYGEKNVLKPILKLNHFTATKSIKEIINKNPYNNN